MTVKKLLALKGKRRITAVTAYDYTSALLAEAVGFDVVLVGDSAAMVIHGYESTLPIGMEEMLIHARVVARVVKGPLVVADMPFLSYQTSEREAIKNAGTFMKLGVSAVKVEGGREVADLIGKMVSYGIPVMGHIGMNPQKFNIYGGFKLQGRDKDELLKDALSLQDAGVFSIVLEKVPAESAKYVSERLRIPTIGIGAGPYTDGQILVFHDILGLIPDMNLKFVRRYLNGYDLFKQALENFKRDILEGNFPSPEESYE
ncbi:MAG: 3-methyl-2-oxobutanoate hydroxymethyltransferase [Thermotogae bacterium]|nr:3-methyl-2-oxobutanoate hydroxymethyltransferase [Thermotogota bacterium]